MNFGDFAAIPVIAIFCYFVGMIVKNLMSTDNKWIPVICGMVGMVVAIGAARAGLPFMPDTDVFTAAVLGIVSGLSAVGVNQIGKQLGQDDGPTGPDGE
jgi:hypothetical protein